MEFIPDALDVVLKAEQAVADLARQAVEQREYAVAASLTNLAGELRTIAEHAQSSGAKIVPAAGGVNSGAAVAAEEARQAQPRAVRRKPKKGEFPKFLRDEGTLYKLGWSKSQKTIYEHKTAKSALTALVKKLVTVGPNRRRFTVEDVLPLPGPSADTEVPTYQVYLSLAWLRSVGLLIQHGRQGYSIAHPARFESDVEGNWQQIPLRQDTQP